MKDVYTRNYNVHSKYTIKKAAKIKCSAVSSSTIIDSLKTYKYAGKKCAKHIQNEMPNPIKYNQFQLKAGVTLMKCRSE